MVEMAIRSGVEGSGMGRTMRDSRIEAEASVWRFQLAKPGPIRGRIWERTSQESWASGAVPSTVGLSFMRRSMPVPLAVPESS